MYISIEQAIDVYEELIEALHGTNGFGGDTAEIYVFRLLPNNPGYDSNSSYFEEEKKMVEKKAAEQFHTLCHIFSKKHNVDILIGGINYNDWISKIRTEELMFRHRIHVTVKEKTI